MIMQRIRIIVEEAGLENLQLFYGRARDTIHCPAQLLLPPKLTIKTGLNLDLYRYQLSERNQIEKWDPDLNPCVSDVEHTVYQYRYSFD